MSIMVLGLGNTLMSDDGCGVRALAALAPLCAPASGIVLLDGGISGLDLLPRLQGIDRLLVIDALELKEEPGAVRRLAGAELSAFSGGLAAHHLGLRDLLAAAELCDCLPGEVVVWGVQPASLEPGEELTPAVAAAIEALVAGVLDELRRWGVLPAQGLRPGPRG